ncbi:ABC transporter permease subunit [Camelliibacillus cellulosilyticus]|uniref:ABC transporter permease subunit n=1 Tax=Camelliibacillus cellulosilyticus TaxID=2174486 RepID=A0ABV9GL13_9BACL
MAVFTAKNGLKFILTAIGIIFVGALPSLFNGIKPNVGDYFYQIAEVFRQLAHPSQLAYVENGMARPLFPQILGPYTYSMTIFFASFFLALILSLILTYVTFFLPAWLKRIVKFLAFIGESLPDLFIIVLFQLIVVWIYMKTHVLVADVAAVWGHQIYLLPIICLSILPTFLFYRIMVLACDEEMEKDYIELAKSKGVKKQALLLRHILRNMLVTIFFHSKTIIWVMLSNLLIFEYLFNMLGITLFMYDHPVPTIFTIAMLMIFVPIFLLFTIAQFIIGRVTNQKVVG